MQGSDLIHSSNRNFVLLGFICLMTPGLLQKIHIKTFYLVAFFTKPKVKLPNAPSFSLPPQQDFFLIEQENCIKTY